MKLLFLVILISCQQGIKVSDVKPVVEKDVGTMRDTSWDNLDSKIISKLKGINLDDNLQKEGQVIYRFLSFDFHPYSELYELNNINNKIKLRYFKFVIDTLCNPVTGPIYNFTTNCIIVQDKTEKYLNETKLDTLNKLFKENEFWELSEFESRKYKFVGCCNDGPTWIIEANTIDKDKENSMLDSLVLIENYHKIQRSIVEDYPSVINIGNYFKNL